ncbi:MAG TPA: hypothetical protein VM529_16830, partial [Gemmata sp.]|nr:hypothetical protein [Gemmata sp.]
MALWNHLLRRFWRERSSRHAASRRFRPSLAALEDRTVLSADLFANATVLTGMLATDTGTNVDAGQEEGEVAPLGTAEPINSVWWQWTAPVSGTVEVNTLGSGLDTVLGVWTGDAVNALTLVGANDDFYDLQSRVVFEAVEGDTYKISVDGYQADVGEIVLTLATTPTNDDFAAATPIGFGTVTGNTTGATAEPGERSSAGTSGEINSVWWAWTAASDGPIEVNTFGSELDTLLA